MGGYGLPLRCVECATRFLNRGVKAGTWFPVALVSNVWLLKVPGVRAVPCPNCGAKLVATRRRE